MRITHLQNKDIIINRYRNKINQQHKKIAHQSPNSQRKFKKLMNALDSFYLRKQSSKISDKSRQENKKKSNSVVKEVVVSVDEKQQKSYTKKVGQSYRNHDVPKLRVDPQRKKSDTRSLTLEKYQRFLWRHETQPIKNFSKSNQQHQSKTPKLVLINSFKNHKQNNLNKISSFSTKYVQYSDKNISKQKNKSKSLNLKQNKIQVQPSKQPKNINININIMRIKERNINLRHSKQYKRYLLLKGNTNRKANIRNTSLTKIYTETRSPEQNNKINPNIRLQNELILQKLLTVTPSTGLRQATNQTSYRKHKQYLKNLSRRSSQKFY